MRLIATLLLVTVTVFPSNATPDARHMNFYELYGLCQSDPKSASFYIAGVLDHMNTASRAMDRALEAESPQEKIFNNGKYARLAGKTCLPDKITADQVRDAVCQLISRNLATPPYDATLAIGLAVVKTWKCGDAHD
ncbi:Rap1a/Tai family immunity protein [Rhizobium rhizogenes]|uniref:Rap1a/Tai family immunity protein n=1 Tax=Rhizobium rhizogenes TaxID=359 RepID=UPI002271D66E|nr:Rap1a/Tai family immunity protein [Rhizobium rhizogenes]